MAETSIANKGIAAELNQHLLIADDLTESASHIVELPANDEKSVAAATESRSPVEKSQTWKNDFQALENHLCDFMKRKYRDRTASDQPISQFIVFCIIFGLDLPFPPYP